MVLESGQAGDEKCDEIEVTPEMIEAGALLLSRINDDLADGHIGLKIGGASGVFNDVSQSFIRCRTSSLRSSILWQIVRILSPGNASPIIVSGASDFCRIANTMGQPNLFRAQLPWTTLFLSSLSWSILSRIEDNLNH